MPDLPTFPCNEAATLPLPPSQKNPDSVLMWIHTQMKEREKNSSQRWAGPEAQSESTTLGALPLLPLCVVFHPLAHYAMLRNAVYQNKIESIVYSSNNLKCWVLLALPYKFLALEKDLALEIALALEKL